MLSATAILLASGNSSRIGGSIPKQFLKYKEKILLEWSLSVLENYNLIKNIILVVNKEYKNRISEFFSLEKYKKISDIVEGGETRQISSYNAIKLVKEPYLLIHDSARPNITEELLNRIFDFLSHKEVVIPCLPVVDTVYQKKLLDTDYSLELLDRDSLLSAQTPQAFSTSIIKKAHLNAIKDKKIFFTDDASIVASYGLSRLYFVQGDINNKKITYKNDF
jgi:2-C-methyl-D-erythritol 4-phosphate cytidylyltransferase